ncbi:MAG: adenylyl-sulfate kinase [Candidatus Nitrospinota bacterium M3_3B_026]
MASENTVWHHATVKREDRENLHGHKSAIVWLTGLSGAGKSTISHATEEKLHKMGCHTFVMDGDNVRHGLCSDLGFTAEDRHENLRRIGEGAKLFLEAGVLTFASFISPYRSDRERVRSMVPHGEFFEVYCRCPLEVCEKRDVKGLYKRARAGEISEFTGISSPYEEPLKPELVLDTDKLTVDECADMVVELLRSRSILGAKLKGE